MHGRYTLLLEIMSSLNFDYDWFTLDNVSKSALSLSSLENLIVDLAKMQVMTAHSLPVLGIRKMLQTDG